MLFEVSKIKLKYIVSKKDNGTTVAHILRDRLDVSARLLNKLKMNEKILVNSIAVFSNFIVKTGDIVEVKIDFVETDFIEPQKMDLDIIYEDEYFLAINKSSNMVVHPCSTHPSYTLANGVKYYLNNNKKIRAINRLDRDTSGIVLFAKNEYIQELMIKDKNIKKEYIAIVDGILKDEEGTIDAPIARKPDSIMERCISEEGQRAITHYKVIDTIDNKLSVVRLILETGRTHQIRVHLKSLGTPILGDTLYGLPSTLISRQALHAYKMTFVHPITKEEICIVASLPEDKIWDGRNNV